MGSVKYDGSIYYDKIKVGYISEYDLTVDRYKSDVYTTSVSADVSFDVHTNVYIKMASIKDYKVINNKVVIVEFIDGAKEKAICSSEDKFDLETAIEICVLKHILGGSKKYYKILDYAKKQINEIDKKKADDISRKELEKEAAKRREEKRKKRATKKRQKQIDIQREAFLNAMLDYDKIAVDESLKNFNEQYDMLNNVNTENTELN